MFDSSDRVVVDRVGNEPCQEEYLAVSMVRPRSSMETALGQRRRCRGDARATLLWCGSGGSWAMARWTSRRFSTSPDRLGFLWWGKRTVNLRERAPGPHLFLLCVLRDGGPPAFHGLGAPDQGASQRPIWPLGQLAEINLT